MRSCFPDSSKRFATRREALCILSPLAANSACVSCRYATPEKMTIAATRSAEMRSGSFRDSDCRGENRRSAEPVWLGINCWWLVEWYPFDARSAHRSPVVSPISRDNRLMSKSTSSWPRHRRKTRICRFRIIRCRFSFTDRLRGVLTRLTKSASYRRPAIFDACPRANLWCGDFEELCE